MAYDIEYTNEFRAWWESVAEEVQVALDRRIRLLQEHGPALGRPYVDTIKHLYGTRHSNIKEIIVNSEGDTYRVFFAFDPRRVAILLLGFRKSDSRQSWYVEVMPQVIKQYETYLAELHSEGLI